MSRMHCLTVALLLAAATTAFSQSHSTQSIEVRGQSVRTDVRSLCPDVDSDLHEALVKTVQEVATSAVMDVRFQLRGSLIDEVSTGAGPVRYQRALKRAVRGLQCQSKDAAPQVVAMRVRFVDPFEKGSTNAVAAAVSLVPASAAAR